MRRLGARTEIGRATWTTGLRGDRGRAPTTGAGRATHRRRSAMPDVVAVDIGKRFGDRDVVQGLSFEVQRGTIFGIIGPSGCGKTTTIRMLLGVLRPTSGDLRVLGRQPTPVPPTRPRAPGLHAAAVRPLPRALGHGEHGVLRLDLRHELLRARQAHPPHPGAGRALGRPRPAGRPAQRRHAAPPGACRDTRPQPGGHLPGRADGRHRPGPAREVLGSLPGPARRGPDADLHHPVRHRVRVLRRDPGPPRRTEGRDGHAGRGPAAGDGRRGRHRLGAGPGPPCRRGAPVGRRACRKCPGTARTD